MNIDAEIAHCLRREREERAAANAASTTPVHDSHLMMAQRYADRASALFEARFDAQAEAIMADRQQVQSVRKMIIRPAM